LLISAPIGATFTGVVSDKVILFTFAVITTIGVAQSLIEWKPKEEYSTKAKVIISILVGASVGFVGGMVGRGGGSLILPALLILGLKHRNAAAISVFCVNAGVFRQLHCSCKFRAYCNRCAVVSGFNGHRPFRVVLRFTSND